MRVRVTENTRTYWAYAVHELNEGDEMDGELARHLIETAAPVEILDGGTEDGTHQPPGPDGTDGDEGEGPDGPSPSTGDQPPVDGTIDTLMTWIGGDTGRAAAALAAEQAKDKPRSTVVTRLTALTAE